MKHNKKWLIAMSIATMITVNGIVMAAVPSEQQNASSGKQHAFVGKGQFKDGMKGFKQDHTRLLALLKIDAETLKTEMKTGKTLVVIAKEHGVSEQTLKEFMVQEMTQRIEEGVKTGRIPADKKAEMKANIEQRVSDMINGKDPMHRGHGHMPGRAPFKNTKLLALLKIDAETLKTEIKSGKTLVVIAKEHGVSEQTLKNFMVQEMTQRIEEGIKAGRIPADKKDEMKANIENHVSDMINGKGPMHRDHDRMFGQEK